jgi:hypothetical protein
MRDEEDGSIELEVIGLDQEIDGDGQGIVSE